MTHAPELARPSHLTRWGTRLREDTVLLGSLFGVISALAYTGTNFTLRNMAHSQDLDWAIWVSCWKGVPAAITAWVLVAHRAWKGLPALPPRRLVLPLLATGMFMQFVGNVCFQWGLSLGGLALTVPLTFAALIGSGAVLGRLVLGEAITYRSLLAIGVLVLSIIVLSIGAEDATQSTLASSSWVIILGAILTAGLAGVAYGTCGVMIRRTTTGSNVSLPGTLVLLSSTGVVGLGITSWIRMGPERILQTTAPEVLNMLAAGCLNAIAFFACGAALMRLSVVRVNMINASQAAMCAAGGVLWFQEALTVWVVLGTLLTMAGLMMMERAPKPDPNLDSQLANTLPPSTSVNVGCLGAETFLGTIECHPELDSTNNHALKLAGSSELETPALVFAERQSSGRGRGGNTWWSAEGALTFSLILDAKQCGIEPHRWPQVSLMTGLAVCEALQPLLPDHQTLKLKWPNDVLVGGKKLCGILSEVPSSLKGRIVVGIGLNINNALNLAPPEIQNVAVSLTDLTDSPHDLTEVLIRILQQMELEFANGAVDSIELSKRFRNRCWLTGRNVTVNSGNTQTQGFCQGIDEEGALLLETSLGTKRLVTGTVTAIE